MGHNGQQGGPIKKPDPQELRRKAEGLLKAEGTPVPAEGAALRLVHELQVHQIELEMQNEELKDSRAELEELLKRYTYLYHFAPVGYFVVSKDGLIIEANLAGARMMQVERAKLAGARIDTYLKPESRAAFKAFIEKILGGEVQATCEAILSNNGKGSWVVRFEGAVHEEGLSCLVVMTDITDLKLAEEQVRVLSESIKSNWKPR